MKNLLNFIFKYLYSFVFILLEVGCFVLIFTANNYHKVSFLNSSNVVVGTINEQWNEVIVYFKLKSINDSILKENERLLNKIEKYRKDEIPAIENSGIDYVAAKVISINIGGEKNFLTINKGKNSEIKQDMGVIGPNGVVGIIYSSSKNYSSVMPIINPDTKISVKFAKNDYFGSLYWEGKDKNLAILDEIPGYVNVQVGDELVTSGFSLLFPEGVPVGIVHSFSKDKATDFYQIVVDLYTDFKNLSYVYVVKNCNLDEHQNLVNELNTEND